MNTERCKIVSRDISAIHQTPWEYCGLAVRNDFWALRTECYPRINRTMVLQVYEFELLMERVHMEEVKVT